MEERILSEASILAFQNHLILEEKSTATAEKYLRDARAFLIFVGNAVVTKAQMMGTIVQTKNWTAFINYLRL